ncbi:winged helix-turn-helix domain-containing protein [Tunturiibacter gelidiferens]|uniref:winged helix-turn-helix domain-containing protein n=1 Tax=Tunturiibacter gelidiferens TaxID=3069689 RepID=UPI003D9B1144
MQTEPGIVYQFGPFEVIPASGELLKNGRLIRLQELPCRLLVALLENPGEVISREELRGRLWPNGTFVDFDSSLRVAVGKLREALDDNAEDPRYVETVPKRGYRFLVSEVRRIGPTPEGAEPLSDPEPLQTPLTQVAATHGRTSLAKYSIAAVTVIILIAGGIFFWYQRPHATPLTDKDVLVLADFTNTTGDPVFDGTLRQALAIQLEQSPS